MSKPWTEKRSRFWWRVTFALFGVSIALSSLGAIIRLAT